MHGRGPSRPPVASALTVLDDVVSVARESSDRPRARDDPVGVAAGGIAAVFAVVAVLRTELRSFLDALVQ